MEGPGSFSGQLCLYLGFVWVLLWFFFLIYSLHLSLGLAGTDGTSWVSVIYLPDQGDLNYLLSGHGGEV